MKLPLSLVALALGLGVYAPPVAADDEIPELSESVKAEAVPALENQASVSDSATSLARDPASSKKKSSANVSSHPNQSGGPDSVDGYIIRKTDKGIVKIPRKQTYKFEGSNVEGAVNRPSDTVLGTRLSPTQVSLIPVRTNFRSEVTGSMAYPQASSYDPFSPRGSDQRK